MYLDAFFNDLTAEMFPVPVYLIKVEGKSDSRLNYGLVLRRKNATKYTRLGIFEYPQKNMLRDVDDLYWLDSGEVQTVTIV
jgi:hypothetical protein